MCLTPGATSVSFRKSDQQKEETNSERKATSEKRKRGRLRSGGQPGSVLVWVGMRVAMVL
jgi:hypothetical protein